MLALRDVQKVYRTGLIETTALAGVSVHVERGEFVAVMGPSGSGKTTLLNVAGLLDTIDGGELVIDGTSVARLSDDALAELRNRHIGFVFQSFNLMQDLDVYDNVDVPLRYRGLSRRQRRERVETMLGRVGLTARMHHLLRPPLLRARAPDVHHPRRRRRRLRVEEREHLALRVPGADAERQREDHHHRHAARAQEPAPQQLHRAALSVRALGRI